MKFYNRGDKVQQSFVKSTLILSGISMFFLLVGCGINGKMEPMSHLENDGREDSVTTTPRVDFSMMPLSFLANKGQVNENVRFYAKNPQYTLWLTQEGMVFDKFQRTKLSGKKGDIEKSHRDVSKLSFVNANKSPEILPLGKTSHQVNYMIGNDSAQWHNDIPTYEAVLYKDLYTGIDLKIYGREKKIEYDWIVHPGENPDLINFTYDGVKETSIDDEGNLLIVTQMSKMVHKRPFTYQEIDGRKIPVVAEYKKTGKNRYGFSVGQYDRSRELIIDPIIFVYSTYLGGSADDIGYAIAVDDAGYVYVTGSTNSTDFPFKNGFSAISPGEDIFISKIDTSAGGSSGLLYSTYIGGEYNEVGYDIAVDDNENVYITGYTASSDFPVLNGYDSCVNDTDAIVVRIDTTESGTDGLVYSTCLDGIDDDRGRAIALGDSGIAYITGDTDGDGLPGNTDGDFPQINQFQECDDGGAFISQIDTNKSGVSSLLFSSCLGGGITTSGYGIAVDSGGKIYVAGVTKQSDFPTVNPYQSTLRGFEDVFITRIDRGPGDTASIAYSTYLGGANVDYPAEIAIDDDGDVYVTGYTRSAYFPVKNQYQKNQNDGDVFVSKLDTNLSGAASLIYSTYLGGQGWDNGEGIVLGGEDNVYIVGWTTSTDYPLLDEYDEPSGSADVFISKLDTSKSGKASLINSNYFGGTANERGLGIALDSEHNIFVCGWTESTDFPTVDEYQISSGGRDAFIAKLVFEDPGPFALSLQLNGEGQVTSEPEGIDCPGKCSAVFDKGSSVTLTAMPAQGAIFGGWTGAYCNGETCTVKITENVEIVASFGKKGAVSWLELLLDEDI